MSNSMLSPYPAPVTVNGLVKLTVCKTYAKPEIALLGSFSALTNTNASGPLNDGQGKRSP